MVSAIVFDFWGVLAQKRTRIFDLVKETLDLEESAHGLFLEYYYQTELGALTEEAFWQELCARLKAEAPKNPLPWNVAYETYTSFNDDTLHIAQMLKANGYRLAVLSNMDPGIGGYLSRSDWLKSFDDLFLSYQIKFAKPDRQAYDYVLKNLHLTPDEVVFVDDREENVLAANGTGMHGLVFKNSAQLITDLERLSVKLDRPSAISE